jgi:hypothetical protein
MQEGFALGKTYRVLIWVFTASYLSLLGVGAVTYASGDDAPSSRQIAFAKTVSDLMLNELVAALFTEFDETTVDNVEHGKQAISLIFNDLNRDMRLIGGFRPLLGGANDRPDDRFETTALRRALDGGKAHTDVQKINDTWYYRRSVPLTNTMHVNCVLCHTNFTSEFFEDNPGQWVGALVLRVPIRTGREH